VGAPGLAEPALAGPPELTNPGSGKAVPAGEPLSDASEPLSDAGEPLSDAGEPLSDAGEKRVPAGIAGPSGHRRSQRASPVLAGSASTSER
jgi:hypothetical protein